MNISVLVPRHRIRVRQREVAALSGAPRRVSYLVPAAATRSDKSERPDSSQPGCGSINRNPAAHTDKSNHMDKSSDMGSIPALTILAHL